MHKDALLATLHKFVNDNTLSQVIEVLGERSDLEVEEFKYAVLPHVGADALSKWSESFGDKVNLSHFVGQLQENGVKILTIKHPDYPAALLKLRLPPPALYIRGDTDALNVPGFGICGSRHASSKGLMYAQKFGKMVAGLGVPEVSGYAKGVDTEAHIGALTAGGRTTVVLAEGILNFRLKKPLRALPGVLEQMVIVSQFHATRPWHVSNAMKRNKTICGLANGLVVVEAQAGGGTLDAGEECLRQNKPLVVIQYDDSSEMPEGNVKLIRMGGIPVRSTQELFERLSTIKIMDASNSESHDKQMCLEFTAQAELRGEQVFDAKENHENPQFN